MILVLSCQFILLFGILKILSGKKSLQDEWKKNLKIKIQRHRWLLRLAPSTSLIYNNWWMKLISTYIIHCIFNDFFLNFFTASMFKNKNVSLTFFSVRLSNCVVWTKCTILLCIKDRFVQELVQTSQKKFSLLSILMVCVD